ncbi:FAD-dependent thymidylate synthase [Actinoplanes sp. NPDC026670]|uniref:FAD-dependent thymidylate synthase n=1 Tax=Actinoplanes sp. NPDC026670 TaxID=3154700 RepID=UPI0033D4F083
MSIEFRTHSSVILDGFMASDDDVIRAAKVSTKADYVALAAEKDVPVTDKERFIGFLSRDRHGSPFEHNAFRFYVETPLFVAREWFRHRISSFNEESGRYKVLAPRFYVPPRERPLKQIGKPGAYQFEQGTDEHYQVVRDEIRQNSIETYARYQGLLAAGTAREVARDVLPVNVFTSFFWTVNARSAMNFLSLRSTFTEAKVPTFPLWEIDRAAQLVEDQFAQIMPITHAKFVEHGRVAP